MMEETKNYMGMDGFFWFFGKVVDRQDPLALGRVRVRVFGTHPDDETLLPDDMLPWAIPIQPITSAALFGVGQSPTGMLQGTHVFGFFADGKDAQMPFVLGTVASGLGHYVKQASSYLVDGVTAVGETITNAVEQGVEIVATEIFKKLPDSFIAKSATLGPILMRDLGLTDFQAAGILGNLYVESGVISDRLEGKGTLRGPCWPRGTVRKGYGWAQWTNGSGATPNNPGRMDKFIDFVKTNFNNYDIEKNAATDTQNYRFLIYELTKGEMKNILTRGGGRNNKWVGLKNTKTVEEATLDFMKSFERPNGALAHVPERINAATGALNSIRNASVPVNSTGKPQVKK